MRECSLTEKAWSPEGGCSTRQLALREPRRVAGELAMELVPSQNPEVGLAPVVPALP